MKRLALIVVVLLAAALVPSLARPAAADPPVTYTGPINVFEPRGGLPIVVLGTGTYTAHIHNVVTPGKNKSLENSWIEVTDFSGTITLGTDATPYEVTDARVRIQIHLGDQANQPVVHVNSSVPLPLPAPFNVAFPGTYTNLQVVGGNIIHAH